MISTTNMQFAEVRIAELAGENGIIKRLYLTLDLTVAPDTNEVAGACLHAPGADISVTMKDAQPRLLGRAFNADAAAPVRQRRDTQRAQLRLAVDLTRSQLDALERERQGQAFTLALKYHGLLADARGHLRHLEGEDSREIHQAEWVKVLEGFGYGSWVLIELPLGTPESHPNLRVAIEEFAVATSRLATSPARDSIAACRRVLDALAIATGEDPASYDLTTILKKSPTLDKRARFAAIRKSLTMVADASVHGDQHAIAIDWTYNDALAIVTHTATLIRYHAALLHRGKSE